MDISDNVLRQCLRHVYFITGTPCGGKSTISRALAEKYGFALYSVDDEFARHKSLSNPVDQPAMNQSFANADEFFLRPREEYAKWLTDNTREQMSFILADLIALSKDQTVVCDLHLSLAQAPRITTPARIAYLIRNPVNVIEDYCNRPDHLDFKRFIESASNPSLAKENCGNTLLMLNQGVYSAVKTSPYFWVERDANSTVSETLRLVETHFGLVNANA